jgi:hypothetical protein
MDEVDRTQRTLTDGSPVTPDHRDIDPKTGQQKGYVMPEWIYVELLDCPYCRKRLERVDNRNPWLCPCGYRSDGRQFDRKVKRAAHV